MQHPGIHRDQQTRPQQGCRKLGKAELSTKRKRGVIRNTAFFHNPGDHSLVCHGTRKANYESGSHEAAGQLRPVTSRPRLAEGLRPAWCNVAKNETLIGQISRSLLTINPESKAVVRTTAKRIGQLTQVHGLVTASPVLHSEVIGVVPVLPF